VDEGLPPGGILLIVRRSGRCAFRSGLMHRRSAGEARLRGAMRGDRYRTKQIYLILVLSVGIVATYGYPVVLDATGRTFI
jgi:hypothetical protein